MRKGRVGWAIALMALSMAAAGGASAQFFPGPPQGRYYEERWGDDDGYYERRPRRYYEEERWRSERRRDWQERRYAGRICVTSRGSCPTDPRQPPGTRCRCEIPGFGSKRGNVQ